MTWQYGEISLFTYIIFAFKQKINNYNNKLRVNYDFNVGSDLIKMIHHEM